MFIHRALQARLEYVLSQGKSILLLGPRQTGKTTLLKHLQIDAYFTFADPIFRQETERNLAYFKQRLLSLEKQLGRSPLIVIDEVQKVPEIMDLVQYLIDEQKIQFILTGSSARKLKRPGKINLLPGRVILLYLDPLSLSELPHNTIELQNLLLSGSLPEIYLTADTVLKEQLLQTYVSTYLEEEVRSEALVRNMGHFSQFLQLAAIESGNIVNLSKLSQELGIAHTTIANYYQILEDCLVAFRIEPYLSHAKRKLLKSARYLLFDMGIKRVCAHESLQPTRESLGRLFEHYIGLELVRLKNSRPESVQIKYWRSYDGPEIDWIIETPDQVIPIEVKLSAMPNQKDARHLALFLTEYPQAKQAYIICTAEFAFEVIPGVTALPWQDLTKLLK